MIFQEPMTALDPLYRIGDQIAAPIFSPIAAARARAALARAGELIEQVGIARGRSRSTRVPASAIGRRAAARDDRDGDRQSAETADRVMNRPRRLDATVQARILDLIVDLQRQLGMAMNFVSHDLRLGRPARPAAST